MTSQHDALPESLPVTHSSIYRPLATPPAMGSAASRSRSLFSWLASGCLLILLLAQLVGMWPFASSVAFAASKPKAVPGHLTLSQFLQEGQRSRAPHGPFTFAANPAHDPLLPGEHPTNDATLPPSAEPPTMKPLRVTLSSAFLAGGPGAQPLDLVSSDQRLEMQLAPGSLDLSHATIGASKSGLTSTGKSSSASKPQPGATTPAPLQLTITEVHGMMDGQVSLLGQYQFQITDQHGKAVQGITLRAPFTIRYHYNPAVVAGLGLDPGALSATWPDLIFAARAAHQPTALYTIPLQNDPKTHTLTGESHVLSNGPLDTGSGTPANQSPPTPLVASVSGNSGQLSYSYPLTVAPGPPGTTPDLQLVYSSEATNERTNRASPASDFGEGWSLSLGAITADEHPAGSAGGQTTWYSLSGVDGISDLLVPNPQDDTQFLTEHISYLRIRKTSANGQPCFQVWDSGGTRYDFGCTSDSLQYYTDGNRTRHNYRWDVDKIAPANEGPGTDNRFIQISYLQDGVPQNNPTTIRDSAIKQIIYGTSTNNPAGTIDFNYGAPFSDGQWAYQYVTCSLRCDDPVNYQGGLNAPQVMSTLTINSITSYAGSDSSGSVDYSYRFNTDHSGYTPCTDDYTQLGMYCAGEFKLESVTPTVYQNGQGTQLPALEVGYQDNVKDDYTDTTQWIEDNQHHLYFATYWSYLTSYDNLADGVGATIAYKLAYNNSDGTPDVNGDNRYDPWHCTIYGDCIDNYGYAQDRAWSLQTVASITTLGTDSSSSQLQPATTQYHYLLTKTGQWNSQNQSLLCYPWPSTQNPQEKDCVGDNWIPANDGDWADYYHSEYRGFNYVYITSPSGDLTVQHYAGTNGWNSAQGDPHNYTNGALEDEEIYQGSSTSGPLLQETQNVYAGDNDLSGNGTAASCNGNYSGVYTPCEVILLTTRSTDYEGTSSSSAPWVETDNVYDDYTTGGGLITNKPVYHNLQSSKVSSSNAATITKTSTYQVTDSTNGSWVYYNIHEPVHSEIDDSAGHVWACQDVTYDEGVQNGVPQPDAGWPTTTKTYSNCANQSNTTITTYNGYDVNGDLVASVDGVGAANAGFYGSGKQGCPLGKPQFFTSAWTAGTYTTCTVYDSLSSLPTSATNAFGQATTTAYDSTQGDLPITQTDVNKMATNYTYSYPNGDATVQTSEPGDTPPSYTTQSQSVSNCTGSSTLPCFQIDTNTSLYNTAITRTFYDSLGRKVETRSPGPDTGYDTIQFTVSNDQLHTSFTSIPFEVTSGSGWLDPNGATDRDGHTPTGSVTFLDALGRTIATQDPLYGSSQEPGLACSATLSSTYTACTNYSLDSAVDDSATYEAATSVDANGHVSESFTDALGNTRYTQTDSGLFGKTLTPVSQTSIVYNALNKPITVTATDLAPQSGETVKSVTTSMQYDDLGRLTQLVDPDRGTYSYSYDADGHLIEEVSGKRTLGYNYDLLGRLGCEETAAPTPNATGTCSAGTPLVQNTYDQSAPGVTWANTDYPVGRLTQSVSTTVYPDGTQATSTESMQYDQRGRVQTQQLALSLPSSWGVTTALPVYQLSQGYNDANQPASTQTSTIANKQQTPGYTFTQDYDSTTGTLLGLSNNLGGTPDLASLQYNVNALVAGLTYYTSVGSSSVLANEQFSYDGDLRPQTDSAAWGSGSGQSGQIFSEGRWYDTAGNVVSLATTQAAVPGQSSSGGSETENFCSNEQDELVWASNTTTPSPTGAESCGSQTPGNSLNGASYTTSYIYTHLGQLWQGPVAGGSTNYQYLYCNTAPHQLSGLYASGSTCSNKSGSVYKDTYYDAWGNVTSRTYNSATATLAYDELDQMVNWNVNASTNDDFAYDASGDRTVQHATSGGTTTLTVYAFGLEDFQYSGTGTLQSSTSYYSLDGRLMGVITGLISPVTVVFLSDALGNLMATFNNTQGGAAVQGNQVYGPYGNSLYSSGSMDTARGYTGQYADTLTGLDYYVSRYYDPVAGIFLSADIKEGNAAGMNPYTYVVGNPETDSDPTGQYYSNGTQLGEHGGEIAYVYGNIVTTVTNDGAGIYYPLYGPQTWSAYGGLSINVATREQFAKYGGSDSATDPQYSTATKFAAVTGWTQLQQSWNAPYATTQSRLLALLHFGGTNVNNVLQLAAIMGGGDDEGMLAGAGAIDGASSTLVSSIKDIFTNPSVLNKMTPQQVVDLASIEGWQVGTLTRGSHEGEGLIVREVNDNGNLTGWLIQWHPGGGHHGPDPYWKVSSPKTGTIRIESQSDGSAVEEVIEEILEDDL